MEPSAFTIEFAEHITIEKQNYCLDQLAENGAEVKARGGRTFDIVCSKPSQLARIGWSLYETHFSRLCRVVATSGSAKARASEYSKPPNRD
jgi:hypothetical protein